MYDIIEKSPQFANIESMSSGLLLIKDNNTFQFNNVWFSNSLKSIVVENPNFKCYGEGAVLADYLIRKFDFLSLPWEKACRNLLAILQDISKRVDSVGSIDNYGGDLLVFTNSGELKQTTIGKSDGINGIDCACDTENDLFISFSTSKIFSEPEIKEKLKKSSITGIESIQANDQTYSVKYQINGGEIVSIRPDAAAFSLIISLRAISDGELTITLPRTFIDSQTDHADDVFFVLHDGIEVKFYETPTKIDRTLTVPFKKDCNEIEIIGTVFFKKSFETIPLEESKKEFDVKKMHDLAVERKSPIMVQTDKSVYSYGSGMIVTIVNPYFISDEPLILEILNEDEKIVYKNTIPVSKDAKAIYQDIIYIEGQDWSKPGSRYTVKARYSDKNAKLEIATSNFGVVIELDQKIYSWRDKVYITVFAPDLVRDPTSVEEIGHTEDSTITISTSQSQLNKYKLVETGKDTGIFIGEIQFSGFPNYNMFLDRLDIPVLGEKTGIGPNDGKIPCLNKDALTVSLITPTKTISASALIQWNIGEIFWMESSLSTSGEGEVRVVDPDMNLDSEKIEQFEIRVWSDTDTSGIKLSIIETEINTGIFKGIVKFTTENLSQSPILRVSEGDTITAEYVDKTLPEPYSLNEDLIITATTKIGIFLPPLERIKISNPKITDQFGNLLNNITLEQNIMISADLTNAQENSQKFAFLVEIADASGTQVSFDWIESKLTKDQTFGLGLPWTPDTSGKYVATIFVWESLDNPTALSPLTQLDIIVNGIIPEQKNPIFLTKNEEIQQRFPLKPIVSVPSGSSVPGCEKHHKCFIPHKMIIRVNQTVVWNNDDRAAHTITSGTPDGGSDGNFDSSLIMTKNSFAHKFTKKGIYPYFCIVHPWQEGIVVVE